jgi:hypothetical protein
MIQNRPPTDSHTAALTVPSATFDETPKQPLYQKLASDFQSKDLDGLKLLEEGWFVEFKDRVPDTAKLARSISSFANSHGGLLVIGAREEQKTRRLESLTPMSQADAEHCVVRAREAVIAHVAPPPYFEAKAVGIDSLSESVVNRWVVVISVPKGNRGPYLHSNGCIYVRVGDAAAPHALADLTQQERLWADSLGRKARIKSRIEHLSKQFQVGIPSVHLVILADDQGSTMKQVTFEDFHEIALAPHTQHGSPVFDQVQTLDTSLVARRTEQQVDAAGVFWDFDRRRSLHFIQLPIATHFWSGQEFDNRGEHFNLAELASRLQARATPGNLMILNLLPTLYFLSVIIRKVKKLHQREGYRGQLKLTACAVDCKGAMPFLGTPAYFSEVEASSFPYVMRDIGFFGVLDDASTWLNFEVHDEEAPGYAALEIDVPTAFGAFSQIAQSLGISPFLSLGVRSGGSDGADITIDAAPLASLFADLHSNSFSFTSQQNPKARHTT